MKKLKVLVWSMCLVLGACAVKPTTEVYTSERGTQWEWIKVQLSCIHQKDLLVRKVYWD